MSNYEDTDSEHGLEDWVNLVPLKVSCACIWPLQWLPACLLESGVTTLGLEKKNKALRTLTGNWFTICMCLYNLTKHFQVIDFSSEGNFFNFFFHVILFHFQVCRDGGDVAAFEICLEGYGRPLVSLQLTCAIV